MVLLYIAVNYTSANPQLYGMIGFLTALLVGAMASLLVPKTQQAIA